MNFHTSKKSWSSNEDAALLEVVAEQGAKDWSTISMRVGTRSAKQCRERYHNHLQPNVKKGEWSPEEDDVIFSMQPQVGNQWAKIAKYLPGRTDNAVKNRWHAVVRSKMMAEGAGGHSGMSAASDDQFGSDAFYESDFSSSSFNSNSSSGSSGGSIRRKGKGPSIPSLALGGISIPAPTTAWAATPNPTVFSGNGLMYQATLHGFSDNSASVYRSPYDSELCEFNSEIDSFAVGEQVVDSGRSDSTFREILGELSNSLQNQVIGDNSDLYLLNDLSARSDLIHDEAVDAIAHFNPSISEHCLSARGYNDNDSDELYLSASPRPWWEEDDLLFEAGDIDDGNFLMGSVGKPKKGGLSVAQLRSPRSPALFMMKRLRA